MYITKQYNTLPLIDVGSNTARDLGSFMGGSYPASLRNIGGSTRILARA